MQTYISILRGINVSGHNLIKMKALQEMYVKLGFTNVKTYIQSGNVVFESERMHADKLSLVISEGIRHNFGFDVPVIVITNQLLKDVVANNMFIRDRGEDISKLHVTFLSEEPLKNLVETIEAEKYLPDEFHIIPQAVCLFCPNGYGNTKLSNAFFEKRLKVQATTRNWKTITELAKMIE
jgi:uncharacterized protein (DUF1697 family)